MKEQSAIVKPCTCLNCHEDMLEFIVNRNRNIPYRPLLKEFPDNKGLSEYIGRFDVYKFKCINCGKEFTIDWRMGIPCPTKDVVCLY